MKKFFLLFLFISCGSENKVGTMLFERNQTIQQEQVRDEFDAFMVVVQEKCISCHYEGSRVGRNFQEYTKPQDWIDSGDITPGRPDLSPAFYLIRGAGIYPEAEFVPSLNRDLEKEEIETIRTFINEYDFSKERL